jgi:three-Cys-motif partner protein
MTLKTPVWSLEPHSHVKHQILQHYLEAWFPILSSTEKRVLVLDGFSGPGRYAGGEIGSPLVALLALQKHRFLTQAGCEVTFVFFEPDPLRFANLEKEIDQFFEQRGGRPANVRVLTQQTEFADGAEGILSSLGAGQLAPTFAFVDPFGFSGIPLDLICRLLSFDKCELFLTFMFDSINRFITHEPTSGHLDALFGTKDYLCADGISGEERKRLLHEIYARQLRDLCSFRYVRSFEMVGNRGHTIYSLFYGTRHQRGLERMKDAMWKADPGAGSRFSDKFAGQQVLLAGDLTDFQPLRSALMSEFGGRTVKVSDLEEFVLVHTPYRKAHLRRQALNLLKKDGLVTATKDGFPTRGFPTEALVEFKPKDESS